MATPRTQLSRERILAAAGHVVEKDGLEALSMRRLAQELDVWPMSVYRHFRDKDDLLDALVGSAAGEVGRPSETGSWRERMRALLEETRGVLGAHPGGLVARALPTPGLLRLFESGMSILRDAGFTPAQAAHAWRALWSYTAGFATLDEPAALRIRAAIAGLPAPEHPALAWAGHELAGALADDAEFAAGLERLLDGLEAAGDTREP